MINFIIGDDEEEAAVSWIKTHKCENKRFGNFSWIINPTHIGYSINIRCDKCGAVHDVTNYDRW